MFLFPAGRWEDVPAPAGWEDVPGPGGRWEDVPAPAG